MADRKTLYLDCETTGTDPGKLGTVCEYLGVPLGDAAHDALADIRATRLCMLRLQERFPIAEVTTAPWPTGKD